jgi:competence protein ComEC
MPGTRPGLGLARGDRVRVMGWLTPPLGPANPGEPDRRRWARMSNDGGFIHVSSPELVTRTAPRSDPGGWAARGIDALRARSLALIAGDGSHERGRAVLAAILLGEREEAFDRTNDAFQRTGTAHLLAISGFHLAVLSMLGLYLVRLTGDRGRLEPLVAAVLVGLVLVLVPARVPIVRAGVMVLALLAGDALGRRYDRLTLLGWTTLALFVWRPMDVFALGAQLSVGITALLLWVAARRHPWIAPVRILGLRRSRVSLARRVWRSVRSAAAVCVMCWAVSLPIVMMHTGVVSLAGAATTLLITPIVVVLLGAGYAALGVGLFFPGAAAATLASLAAVADRMALLVAAIAGAPELSFEINPPSPLWAAAAVATVLVYLARAHVRAAGPIVAAVVVAGWAVAGNIAPARLPPSVALRIDMLSVGDGSCLLVRSGGDTLIWDCGSLYGDLSPVLTRARRALGIPTGALASVSHANLDHYVSLPDAADVFGIGRVLVSPHIATDDGAPVRALRAELAARGVDIQPVRAGFSMALGDARLTLLWPAPEAEDLDYNDRSLVAMLAVSTDAGDRRVLLCGDIEEAAMEALLAEPERLAADVLEAPHHGSFKPAALRFVAAVGPRIIMQSTGRSRVDDPRWSGQRARSRWLCTARDGAITVEIMRDGTIRARTMR